MAQSTLPLDRFAHFSGQAPPVSNRRCLCGHREADAHILNWRGHRSACGATVRGYISPVRCPCNEFTPVRVRTPRIVATQLHCRTVADFAPSTVESPDA